MNETIDFVRSIYRDIDTMDVRNLSRHLTEDCIFIFANALPLVGRIAVEDHFQGFMEMLDGMEHQVEDSWHVGEVIISRLQVSYITKDHICKRYPAMVAWEMRGRLINEFSVYVDTSTLFT